MSAASPYSFRFSAGPALIVKGVATTVDVYVERDGAAPTLSSAAYSLVSPAGVVIQDAVEGVLSGGRIRRTVPALATTAEVLGPNYVESWSVTIGGVVYTAKRDAALVACLLHCPIADTDLYGEHRDLARPEFLPDDVSTWQSYIDAAWSDVLDRMVEDGLRYWKIRSPQRLRRVVLCRSLHKIMEDLTTRMEAGDKYEAAAVKWDDRYEAAWGRLVQLLDKDEDGVIDAEESEMPTLILTGRRLPSMWGG